MMTSHETRSTHSARKAASEQNDLKKLKAKYSSKLPTLQFLFNDWTDDDLLFALEEANGDVDLTIDRISEGNFFFSFFSLLFVSLFCSLRCV
jgi:hypothetical protein